MNEFDTLPEVTAPTAHESMTVEMPEQEQLEEVPQEPPQEMSPKRKADEYKNLAALRKKAEQAERERDEAIRLLKEKQESENTNELGLNDDDIVDGKHVVALHKKIKKLEETISNYTKQSTESVAETRLKQKYSDFDSVVNSETIETLKNDHPEIYNTIYYSQGDLYAKGISAYAFIKRLGIVPDSTYDAEKQRIKTNTAKPRPLASVNPQQGESPLSRANAFANGLTDELKEQLLKEMNSARKAY